MAILSILACSLAGSSASAPAFVLACREENDLHRVLAANGARILRCDRAADAIERAPAGGGVLLLADGEEERPLAVDFALLDAAAAKRLRLYIEVPGSLAGIELGPPREIRWERGVIASDFFGPDLPRLRIVGIHGCRFVPVEAGLSHIVLARVAGFDTAVFGLPPSTHPILFEHPRGDILVATAVLSRFVAARYGPLDAWRAIWRKILGWLRPLDPPPRIAWTAAVRPSYGRDDPLPADVEREAFRRGVEWFGRSRLIVHRDWLRTPPVDPDDPIGPLPPADAPRGDGRDGILEGFASTIRADGSQPVRYSLRNDCAGECAMALAFGGALLADPSASSIAANLCDFVYVHSPLARGPRADPASPSLGLVGWAADPRAVEIYYGDDNARSLLGIAAAAAILDSPRWDEALLRTLLGNLRTSGRFGFRGNCLTEGALRSKGWRPFFEGFAVNYAPHYESTLWASYLWAYRRTGYELFLRRAKTAIAMTMAAYPDRWHWTNGIEQERARMLLPLAWLVRVEDAAEHRRWLRRIGEDLVALQDPCGALREELGAPGRGSLPPPSSNEAYGTAETSILQANGDPVCDMLYTSNFAFLGLHEAAAATGESLFVDAEERLAKFLCRIQIRSEARPELDGSWFRAFDFRRWEYWGSNGDLGWGAWSIETGWTHAWIVSVLGMRAMGKSLWDLLSSSRIRAAFPRLRPIFFPDGDAVPGGERIEHKAAGRPVSLASAPDPRYPGIGEFPLTDGLRGSEDYRDPSWQGFWQVDLEATIDLGDEVAISSIESRYLQQVALGIYLPLEVEYAASGDGEAYRAVATIRNDIPSDRPGPFAKGFRADVPGTRARFVRVRAKNIGAIPAGPAKGERAWLFADEVAIE